MKWFTETIITLNPLSLFILLLASMCLGWVIYGLRGYTYWWRRFHQYKTVPTRRQMKQNGKYIQLPRKDHLTPPVAPLPVKRAPQIIHKTAPAPVTIPVAPKPALMQTDIATEPTPAPIPEPVYSTKDDLQVVEGIGPKIEGIMNDNGIHTWRELAQTPVSNLKSILERAGKRFQMHDPKTWPEQSDMANKGQWDELREYQDFLHGGRA